MILKKPTIIFIALSLVVALVMAVPQPVLAVPGICPSGTTYIAKYNWNATNGWVFENDDGHNVITFEPGSNALTGSWMSSVLIDYMVMTDGQYDGQTVTWTYIYVPPTYGPEDYDSSMMLPTTTEPREISNLVFCGPVWPVTLSSFTAKANRGAVTIQWVTATEIDTAGFILYRSAAAEGAQVQLNSSLIAAKGTEVSGASYNLADSPGSGIFYYWLRDVDYSGKSTLHGPVSVKVLPPVRQPIYRPSLPAQ